MPDLLFEILVEEIPARMQARAISELRELVLAKLTAEGLSHGAVWDAVTPRRLALAIDDIPERQPERRDERKGPKVGAPQGAIDGFLRSAGLASLDQAEKRQVGNAEVWFAVTTKPGAATLDLLPALLVGAILELGWPKSMRWGAGRMSFVRPIQGLLGLFGGRRLAGGLHIGSRDREAGYDPAGSDLEAFIPFGATTRGHRFLAPTVIEVTDREDYQAKLLDARVVLDRNERCRRIHEGLELEARQRGCRLVEDSGLMEEVAGLVEWPTVLVGDIEPRFMDLPREVLTTSMRSHQKYFSFERSDGSLAPYFALVSNIDPVLTPSPSTGEGRGGSGSEAGGGQGFTPAQPSPVKGEGLISGGVILSGNARVLRARLSDAQFFWDQDRKKPLEEWAKQLSSRVFHAELGTVADRVERIGSLSMRLALDLGVDGELAIRAARLAKADLATGMVGEFPELQGLMGRYYALAQGESDDVARAIAEHYAPQGPDDACPKAPLSVVVALAEKIDALAGFFRIGQTPTGSKDPFALRRAGLGLLRLVAENGVRLSLAPVFVRAVEAFPDVTKTVAEASHVAGQIIEFLADRLKVYLRGEGVRPDLIQAIFSLGDESDFVRLRRRVDALSAFVGTDAGTDLLAAYRRAVNILRIEEKKDGKRFSEAPDDTQFNETERATWFVLNQAAVAAEASIVAEDYTRAFAALANLRGPVDAFFANVVINADDPAIRINRLRLLNAVRGVFEKLADFSQIEG